MEPSVCTDEGWVCEYPLASHFAVLACMAVLPSNEAEPFGSCPDAKDRPGIPDKHGKDHRFPVFVVEHTGLLLRRIISQKCVKNCLVRAETGLTRCLIAMCTCRWSAEALP